MAGAGKKWAMGCGIGCGLMLIIFGGIGTCGFFTAKKVGERVEQLEASFEELDRMYGEPENFIPPADGAVPADRMEVFLAVRDHMAPVRNETSLLFVTLDGDGNFIAKAKAGMKFLGSLADFVEVRNDALMIEGMGTGEYRYIYGLAYYAYLEKNPADGPSFTVIGDDHDDDDGAGFRWSVSSDDDDSVRRERERHVRKFVNRLQSHFVKNQLASLEGSFDEVPGMGQEEWTARVAAEAEAMDNEYLRFLWEDDLPGHIRASLEPYRGRLDESYDSQTSILEMGLSPDD